MGSDGKGRCSFADPIRRLRGCVANTGTFGRTEGCSSYLGPSVLLGNILLAVVWEGNRGRRRATSNGAPVDLARDRFDDCLEYTRGEDIDGNTATVCQPALDPGVRPRPKRAVESAPSFGKAGYEQMGQLSPRREVEGAWPTVVEILRLKGLDDALRVL